MNVRALRLEDYGITKERYRELCNYCRQYPLWVKQLTNIAEESERDEIIENCKLILDTAKNASDLWEYLIDNVCNGKTLVYLISYEQIPCSLRSYCDIKKHFFILLHQKLNMTNSRRSDTLQCN